MRNNLNFNTGKEESKPAKRKFCCTCTKSRCLKKYCECYANKEYCDGCECRDCLNLAQFKNKIINHADFNSYINKSPNEEKEENQKNSEILCNCTKSNCTKKYCECFKAGEGCKELCRCINCENEKKNSRGYSLQKPTLSMEYLGNKNKFDTSEKIKVNRNPMNYVLEGTSVYICNQDITGISDLTGC